MDTKFFEVRDQATCVYVVAIELNGCFHPILTRSGYGLRRYISIASLNKSELTYNFSDHTNRTMQVAHRFIIENWDELETGDVVDVEFILGETIAKKEAEWLQGYNI